jgi:transcriptional regulatory protein LevR
MAEVIRFDNARQCHKRSPNDTDYAKDHMKHVAIMETSVSKQQRHYKAQLSQWEKYFLSRINAKLLLKMTLPHVEMRSLLSRGG